MAPERPQATQKAIPPSPMPPDKQGWRVTLAHAEVPQLLSEHRDELDNLAHALPEPGPLDAQTAYAAAGIPMPRTEARDLTGAGSLT